VHPTVPALPNPSIAPHVAVKIQKKVISVIYLTVWRARPRHRQALELPIIKGGQHATSVCRYARDPAHRVFGDSAKVRV
jgi:hypothetical protein